MILPRSTWKIALLIIVPLLGIVILLGLLFQHNLREALLEDYRQSLKEKAALFLPYFSEEGDLSLGFSQPQLQAEISRLGRASKTRITCILPDGRVIADSEKRPTLLDNHRDRPEVLQAIAMGAGSSRRFSASTEKEMIYFARRLDHGGKLAGVMRLSLDAALIDQRSSEAGRPLLAILLLSLFLGGAIVYWLLARYIAPVTQMVTVVDAMREGDSHLRARTSGSREISNLGHAINRLQQAMTNHVIGTQREQEKLNAILAAMGEGVVAIDDRGRVLFCNPAARDLLHIESEAFGGRLLEEIVRHAEVIEIAQRALEEQQNQQKEFTSIMQGESRILRAEAHPFGLQDQQGVLIVVRDESETRRLEKIRQDFVANASHELRTPLTAIKGYIDTLLDGAQAEAETRERFLRQIDKNVTRLTSLTGDLLTLSRAEAKEGKQPPITFDPAALLEEVISSQKLAAQQKSISLEILLPDQRAMLIGRPRSFSQIAQNLVDNAIKYTEPGGQVMIDLQLDQGCLTLRVRDNGIGIPAGEHTRIFERFYRVDKGRSVELGGTGLGLSIVKHLVKESQGEIHLESEVGRGSLFTVVFPIASDAN